MKSLIKVLEKKKDILMRYFFLIMFMIKKTNIIKDVKDVKKLKTTKSGKTV